MSKKKVIRVFEFDEIKQGQKYDGFIFEEKELLAIQKYNTANKNKYFTLIHQGVKFKNYVGVLKIGKLTIEILPKADKYLSKESTFETKEKWRNFMLQMLKKCGFINVTSLTHADLKLRNTSLLDIYINEYLKEVSLLLRIGLRKKYRFIESNTESLKGRLLFQQQITKNLIHKQKFYTSYQTYDRDNLYNQIIYKALSVLLIVAKPSFKDQINRLMINFPELSNIKVNESLFTNLKYDRNTQHYKKGIELSKLILLKLSPDIQSGSNNVIAILFDMNELWEKYIYSLLRRDQNKGNYTVIAQQSKKFWENKSIKPDIVYQKEIEGKRETFIIDTKWKLIDSTKPGDNDLKQMYVYNIYWNSLKSILIYPNSNQITTSYGKFHKGIANKENLCKIGFIKIWDSDEKGVILRESIYSQIEQMLEI
ncbi:MAG: McrC family protein [Flavobacteriales bacterium]